MSITKNGWLAAIFVNMTFWAFLKIILISQNSLHGNFLYRIWIQEVWGNLLGYVWLTLTQGQGHSTSIYNNASLQKKNDLLNRWMWTVTYIFSKGNVHPDLILGHIRKKKLGVGVGPIFGNIQHQISGLFLYAFI